jgi:hypothetical protein
MKTLQKNVFGLFMILSIFIGCEQLGSEDEEPTSVYEKINGTWTISSMNIFGIEVPGDGSTLSFGDCQDGICTGQDYEATDGTTGEFTYQFIESESKILIIDEDPNGGNYNATWAILDFDSQTLRLTGDFGVLGNMQMEMSKN